MEIRPFKKDEPLRYDLLAQADPSHEAVDDYLRRGECFGAFERGRIVGLCVVLRTRPFTTKLVNLAVDPLCQGKGVGKRLIGQAVAAARLAGCRMIEVGTGNSGIGQLAMYQKCGFEIDSVEKDFSAVFTRKESSGTASIAAP